MKPILPGIRHLYNRNDIPRFIEKNTRVAQCSSWFLIEG